MTDEMFLISRILVAGAAAIVAIAASIFSARAAWAKFKFYKQRNKLLKDEQAHSFISQFNKDEIIEAIANYVRPHCSPSDPANKDGEEYLADTRENIFDYMDRVIKTGNKTYNLILADSGMGKTSFCLNYYHHCTLNHSNYQISLLSLSNGDVDNRISSIINKSKTILILDAFDEDPRALSDGRSHLNRLLQRCADFKCVIITCRSQYFLGDDYIPRETPLAIVAPRKIGQSQNFTLIRSYISPFDANQIRKYIDRHFPIWKVWKLDRRRRAFDLAAQIPDLAHRPMLLERLPELAQAKDTSAELYELYGLLVDGWCEREARWIKPKNLETVSFELAIHIYGNAMQEGARIHADEIVRIAEGVLRENPEWEHLRSRSLLNRDSSGRFKFAHRSILEYLLVRMTVRGDNRPLDYPWTDFMKELFVSWGHANPSSEASARALAILATPQARRNVAPLFDMWASRGVAGYPDFRTLAARHRTANGVRLAPPSWRSASIEVQQLSDNSGWKISDPEYNLVWKLINNDEFLRLEIPETLGDIIKIDRKNDELFIPSYDQFLSLVEGLYISGQDHIIPDDDNFLISDSPEKSAYLLVRLGRNQSSHDALRLVDRDRKIGITKRHIWCYSTGPHISRRYSSSLLVRQLWLVNN